MGSTGMTWGGAVGLLIPIVLLVGTPSNAQSTRTFDLHNVTLALTCGAVGGLIIGMALGIVTGVSLGALLGLITFALFRNTIGTSRFNLRRYRLVIGMCSLLLEPVLLYVAISWLLGNSLSDWYLFFPLAALSAGWAGWRKSEHIIAQQSYETPPQPTPPVANASA